MPQQFDEVLLPCPSFPSTAEKLVEPLKLLLAAHMYGTSLAMYWTKTGLIFAVTWRGWVLELCWWGQDLNLTSLPERRERDSLSVTPWKKRHYFPVVGKSSRLRICHCFFIVLGLASTFHEIILPLYIFVIGTFAVIVNFLILLLLPVNCSCLRLCLMSPIRGSRGVARGSRMVSPNITPT